MQPTEFTLTDSASVRIQHLQRKEANDALKLRITVEGGGCSGFQTKFSLEYNPPNADDKVIAHLGAQVLIDEVSMGLLKDSVLDYSEDLSGGGFEIKNPNATAKCGCGSSFSVAL